ncbi:PAS domain-containing hybrid sensor histidine kinase/response regulator [Rariglobus hedericola]|uniref:histidine kinase n=1 Tax=Rariglobus hedericola TaxID=2597822 RepID=A0A556QL86_9BACT|nr:PAS domain-containing sensor histidine kinase [Rariglobus hedericola]TSJ77397.1 PAS domain S-box protein [Rariglobus hedericola]
MAGSSFENAEIATLTAECERLRATLRTSEEQQRILFDSNPLPVWVYDTESLAFLAVNESAIRHYGYSRAEFLGMTIRDIRPARDVPVLEAHLSGIAQTHAATEAWTHLKKDGAEITVDIFSHGIVYTGRAARLVVAVDITTRAAAEEKLRNSEERFQLVSRATSDAVWDWDFQTNLLWWGDGFCALFGYPRTDISPEVSWWAERIHPDDRDRVYNSLHRAIEEPATIFWSEEYRYLRKDGAYAIVQDRGHVIRDAAGKGIRMVGGMTDITEHKKLLNQYLRAQRMESIGTLAGGIAHDLNNVLAPILMSVDLLRIHMPDEGTHKLINTVEQSARRGADLVRQVLTFARGIDGSHRVAIQVEHLIKDVARIATETFPRSIRTEIQAEKDLWVVTGDATQLHQVILNLVVNARDAMPEGGTLTLTAENITIDAQYVATSRAAKPGFYLCIGIADTGCGIPQDEIDRIFEPFFTTKEVGKGTGLGLSTAHAIIESHRGFIAVYSEPGQGSTFKVYVPADPNLRAPASAAPAVADLPRGHGETILVIDDETSILTITRQTLEAFGYQVIVAHDGAEAVAVYAQHRDTIAAVLTDMVMPIMDGPATISALMRVNPHVLIIAASGLNSNGRVAKAAGAGVKHFLPKPYTAETLLITLRDVLRP